MTRKSDDELKSNPPWRMMENNKTQLLGKQSASPPTPLLEIFFPMRNPRTSIWLGSCRTLLASDCPRDFDLLTKSFNL